MLYEDDRYPTVMAVGGIWMMSCVCCALAIVYFYGLAHPVTVLYPFTNRRDQGTAIVGTAVVATLCSSWAVWWGLHRRRSRKSTAFQAAIWTEVSLSAFSLVGRQIALTGWRSPLDLIFSTTLFSEYNWLTFVLEVAPVTSCVVGLLLFWIVGRRKVLPVKMDRSVSPKPL